MQKCMKDLSCSHLPINFLRNWMTKQPSILAIAPGTRHLGFAVFDRGELIRFGVRSFPGRKTKAALHSQVLVFLDSLHKRHHVTTLAVEDVYYFQARASRALGALALAIRRWGRGRKLRVVRYLPTTVKAHFCGGKRTRQALAEAMVRRYWFLNIYLQRNKTQPYWRQMFDAVALGALASGERSQPSGSAETTAPSTPQIAPVQ